MNYIEFTIPGKPFGKQRPRVVNIGGYSRAYTPKETMNYENFVKMEYQQAAKGQRFEDVPLKVLITAFYEIPKSTSKKKRGQMLSGEIRPTKKPDLDNITKIICDSLNGRAYKDDAQIVEVEISKYYAEAPWVDVAIKEVNFDGGAQ